MIFLIIFATIGVVAYWAASVALWCREEIERLGDGCDAHELPWWVKPFTWRAA